MNLASYAVAPVLALVAGMSLYEVDPALPLRCCLALAVLLPIGFWGLSHPTRA